MRIFPEMWARNRWPLFSSTRNMALGRGSTTEPSTSMVSVFLAILSRTRRDGRVLGTQHYNVLWPDRHSVRPADHKTLWLHYTRSGRGWCNQTSGGRAWTTVWLHYTRSGRSWCNQTSGGRAEGA